MSKFCPALNQKVTYLFCQECEDRVCESARRPQMTVLPKKENPEEVVKENKTAAPGTSESSTGCSQCNSGKHPACETCCHMIDQRQDRLFGNDMVVTSCEVHRNYLIDSNKVAKEGCEYHNRDMSQEKICMNCEHFLGGGDWGLACSKHYHRLPKPLTEACEDFDRKRVGENG